MNRWRPQRFLQDGLAAGVDPSVLANANAVAAALHRVSPRLPVVLSLGHLAHLADVNYTFLRQVVSRDPGADTYRFFQLKKKNVGHASDRFRTICVPSPALLKVQRWIHTNILREVVPHGASYAYEPGVNSLEMAQLHCGAKWLIKLDITSFFESVLEPEVYKVFRGLGYQPLVAFEMTRVCTRLRTSKNPSSQRRDRHPRIRQYTNAFMGHLPQGAPTSPMLANLACRSLDEALEALATKTGLIYTRYADDLTFSTRSETFSNAQARAFVRSVYAVLLRQGFFPNYAKSRIHPPGARKVVLGLLVDGAEPKLTREFRDRLRMHIHFCEYTAIGPVLHATNRGFDSVLGLQRHLFGLAAYAQSIDRTLGTAYLDRLRKIDWPT